MSVLKPRWELETMRRGRAPSRAWRMMRPALAAWRRSNNRCPGSSTTMRETRQRWTPHGCLPDGSSEGRRLASRRPFLATKCATRRWQNWRGDTRARSKLSSDSEISFSAADGKSEQKADIFATTHWTVVIRAGRGQSREAEAALEELCRTYWYPLYVYVRRQTSTREDAEDLTQAFFARFLGRNYLEKLTSQKGKFRAFLLASLKHFLANEWVRAN